MQSLGFSVERWLEKVNHVRWSNGIVSHFKWKWTAGSLAMESVVFWSAMKDEIGRPSTL